MIFLSMILLFVAYEVCHALADRADERSGRLPPVRPLVKKTILFDRLAMAGIAMCILGFAHSSLFGAGLLVAVSCGIASSYFKHQAIAEREADPAGFDLLQR